MPCPSLTHGPRNPERTCPLAGDPFAAMRKRQEIAACHPMKDGVIQAFADALADQVRNMEITGIQFDDPGEYRFGQG